MGKGDKSPPTSAGEDRLVLQWQNALEAMKPKNVDFDTFVIAVVVVLRTNMHARQILFHQVPHPAHNNGFCFQVAFSSS